MDAEISAVSRVPLSRLTPGLREILEVALYQIRNLYRFLFFFFNDTATTEIYTLSLHDALPIPPPRRRRTYLPVLPRHRTPRGRDRKSTRLNSSHGSNSYAVFCLKKKKSK